jgi:hypothetical protein
VDCCSLEGRTLKDAKVVELLPEFVLVRLEPLDWEEDAAFGKKFGVEEYPALLLLDHDVEKKLGIVGDVPPEKVAEALRKALAR